MRMDLSLLHALERQTIMQVLLRDRILRTTEEERIRRMKQDLQEIRRKGAKSFSRQYSERTCARCQKPLGKFWNSGAVCRGCSHRICGKCRVGGATSAVDWRCTLCHAYRDVKIRSGEWFLEQRAGKFPVTTDRQNTAGEKLLRSYSMLSNISVVPPTPPPRPDCPVLSRSGDFKDSTFFNRSVEDMMVSFTSHIKNMSKSQNDVRADRLTVGHTGPETYKSLSDTEINKSFNLTRVLGQRGLLTKSRESDQDSESSSLGAEENTSLGSFGHSGGKRGSGASLDSRVTESGSVTGELELSLAYDVAASRLRVTVGGCRNVAYGNVKKKKCHPYVKIYLGSDKRKTSVKRNTTDPVYDEVLQYQVERHLLSTCTLRASVWHSRSLKRKVFLGETLVPLEAWSLDATASQPSAWYRLYPKRPVSPEGGAVEQERGELQVWIKLGPSETSSICQTHGDNSGSHGNDRLTVLIKGVKNLPIRANTGPNTYVIGSLTLSRGRKLVNTTPTLKDSPQLVFDGLSPSELCDCVLVLDLWDHAHLGQTDRQIGGARIDAGEMGLPWRSVLQVPGEWHDFSLPLLANVNSRRT